LLRTIRSAFDVREVWYPANMLSLVRIALIWPTIRALLRPDGTRTALALIAVGMATDAVDGPIARARGEVSELGKLLDPIADKVTLDGVALALSARHGLPWWITGVLLARDIAILVGGSVIMRRSAYITTSNEAGKVTTILLTVALLLHMAGAQPLARWLLYLALLPLGVSWVQYGQRLWQGR
jgi:CDP-diacylglycerol---glycerol-3-phosphate 3-phosphatidyltransferase